MIYGPRSTLLDCRSMVYGGWFYTVCGYLCLLVMLVSLQIQVYTVSKLELCKSFRDHGLNSFYVGPMVLGSGICSRRK